MWQIVVGVVGVVGVVRKLEGKTRKIVGDIGRRVKPMNRNVSILRINNTSVVKIVTTSSKV